MEGVSLIMPGERITTSQLSEYYTDLLKVDSWVVGKTKSVHATSLLCSKLHQREAQVKERLEYLAEKRGITGKELWNLILEGKADDE